MISSVVKCRYSSMSNFNREKWLVTISGKMNCRTNIDKEIKQSIFIFIKTLPLSSRKKGWITKDYICNLPVSAVLGWKTVFVYVTNCSCLFRAGRWELDSIMCFSPSPLTETSFTVAATSKTPSVAVKYTCYTNCMVLGNRINTIFFNI